MLVGAESVTIYVRAIWICDLSLPLNCLEWQDVHKQEAQNVGYMSHRSPTYFGTRDQFHGRQLSIIWGGGNGFGMIQEHYIHCALYFYYYIVVYNERIIQLTIMQNQWESWTCFLATISPIWGSWVTVTPEVCSLCPVYSVILCCFTTENLLHKDRMLEMGAGFLVLSWQFQNILPWLYPECMEIWHCLRHALTATASFSLKQLILF